MKKTVINFILLSSVMIFGKGIEDSVFDINYTTKYTGLSFEKYYLKVDKIYFARVQCKQFFGLPKFEDSIVLQNKDFQSLSKTLSEILQTKRSELQKIGSSFQNSGLIISGKYSIDRILHSGEQADLALPCKIVSIEQDEGRPMSNEMLAILVAQLMSSDKTLDCHGDGFSAKVTVLKENEDEARVLSLKSLYAQRPEKK